MAHFNVLQALYMSFYSKALYQDVARNWSGKIFLYLLFLVALSWIAFTILFQLSINALYNQNSDEIVRQIPVMKIVNGKLVTPENRPYIIVAPRSNQTMAVIDTSGQYKTLEQAKAGILITETEVISQPKENETRTYQIPPNSNLTIDPSVINAYIQKYINLIGIFLFIFFVLGAYIYRIVQALVYAILGKIFSLMVGAQLTYDAIVRITIMALTPPIIAATIFNVFSIEFPFQTLFYFLLAMLYMGYGIVANKVQPTDMRNINL